uniref:NAD(P)-dependent oxidoreductase n=1 Tax=candidate division WOR-3 bacterium TaxID=2052148 RepID=A0A7V3RI84_UNCW3
MILITGATGFIGKNFVLEYTKKYPVKILARKSSNIDLFKDNKRILISYGDLSRNINIDSALDGVDTVIHCAALTMGRNYYEFYRANTLATKNLIEAMKKRGVEKILFLSSQSAGGPATSENGVDETTPVNPISFYGISKKLAEEIVKSSGLNYIILRPCPVYGRYDMEILKIIKLVNRGIFPVVGDTRKCVSLIYIKDLVILMEKILEESHFDNHTYFVSDGVCYFYEDVIKTVCEILEKRYPIEISIPEPLALLFGMLNDLLLPPKRRLAGFDKIKEMCEDFWICSNNKIMVETGWKPIYDLRRGMEETIHWYKINGYLH